MLRLTLHSLLVLIYLGTLVTLQIWPINGASFEEDTRLTAKQKEILDQFKERMLPRLPHEYMKEDIYLIRWLRARHYDLKLADEMLTANLKWREDNRMDQIEEEDWSQLDRDYPMWIEGSDKEGRPIMWMELGNWDIRKAVIAGKMSKLNRQFNRWCDISSRYVRTLQRQGKNVTQVTLLVEMKGLNIVQQVNPVSLPFYLNIAINYESYFPELFDKLIFVNTPQIFKIVVDAVRPILTPTTEQALKFIGTSRKEWDDTFHKWIDLSQLPKSFGGTRDDLFENVTV